MAVLCGHCKEHHGSAADVRACYTQSSPKFFPDLRGKVTAGYYKHGDLYVKVQEGLGSGRPYAKMLLVNPATRRLNWVYKPGLVDRLDPSEKMTAGDAKGFGDLYGVCFKCGRKLTDERSIELGYGRICAEKLGWAW